MFVYRVAQKTAYTICLMLNWYSFVKSKPNFITFGRLAPEQIPNKTKHSLYCPQHLLRVSTLPCRNNIVRFLCCLKIKFAHELCWRTTKQCQSHKIVLISLQAMFNMSSSQSKIIKFGWDFTKAISILTWSKWKCALFGPPCILCFCYIWLRNKLYIHRVPKNVLLYHSL